MPLARGHAFAVRLAVSILCRQCDGPDSGTSAENRIRLRGSSAASRRLDGGDVDLLHRHHRLEGALGLSATGRQRLGQHARGDLPGEAPAVLAPTARAFLAAIADNRIPVAVRLRLIVRGDLKGERLAVLERLAAVETEAGNADDDELHRHNIAGLAARVVARRLVDSGHFTIRKGGGVES